MSPEDPRHGTHAGHVAGCREQCCKDGAARYERGRQLDILNGKPRTVPLIGAMRRVRALQRLGWSAEDLSQRLGFSRAWLHVTINHNGTGVIYRRNFEAIAALYDELCMTLGPSEITRKRAEAKGWPPPLAFDDIDDPDEKPKGMGKSSAFGKSRNLLGEVEHLRSLGVAEHVIAAQLNVTPAAIERAEMRANRRAS